MLKQRNTSKIYSTYDVLRMGGVIKLAILRKDKVSYIIQVMSTLNYFFRLLQRLCPLEVKSQWIENNPVEKQGKACETSLPPESKQLLQQDMGEK
ncbi:hypothetical protein NPIL_423191 [Nephila pilipes]|uniref:Uncharacterized protein n=1 Tax=Nephila pilipes TaxID=299642 RepID=A0A8X6NAU0_NEPPI|nr:hypothetical protein NPIL_423191 [Nephila pilipes]